MIKIRFSTYLFIVSSHLVYLDYSKNPLTQTTNGPMKWFEEANVGVIWGVSPYRSAWQGDVISNFDNQIFVSYIESLFGKIKFDVRDYFYSRR